MLDSKEKEKLVQKHKTHTTDTGSPEVQAALLTEEIARLLAHLKINPKDFHSKRGLLKMVAKRRSLLKYLQRESEERHAATVKKLGLKK